MPKYGVTIVKSVLFRGVQQEFSNRYHYEGTTMTAAQGTQLAQNVKAAEVPLHSTDVSFKRYQVWLDTGSPSTSEMLVQGTLSGVGSGGAVADMDRERAFLIRWPAGTDSRGRPVYLRKWYHSCGSFNGVAISAALLQNTAAFGSTDQTAMTQAGVSLQTVSDGSDAKVLAAPGTRSRTGSAQPHKYLEHHQLGDMWR